MLQANEKSIQMNNNKIVIKKMAKMFTLVLSAVVFATHCDSFGCRAGDKHRE